MTTATAVKAKPIMFSAVMVKAIRAGRKTMTRRLVKWQPYTPGDVRNWNFSGMDLGYYMTDAPSSGYVLRTRGDGGCWNDRTKPNHCPYGVIGDRMWIKTGYRTRFEKERCQTHWLLPDEAGGGWVTTHGEARSESGKAKKDGGHPGMFMPFWLSQEFRLPELVITATRIERLHDITDDDICAEGIEETFVDQTTHQSAANYKMTTMRYLFACIWDRLNGAGSWDLNPWVRVVEFKATTDGN